MAQEKETGEASTPEPVGLLSRTSNDIWFRIRDHITDSQTLDSLVQVCKAFRAIFQPKLYESAFLDLGSLVPTEADSKSLWTGIELTKDLEVFMHKCPNNYSKPEKCDEMNDGFAIFLRRVLEASSELRSFTWSNNTSYRSYAPTDILRKPGLLDTLKKIPTLEKVSMQFQDLYLFQESLALAEEKWFCPLSGFCNLTSLELYEIYGPKTKLVSEIAGVLSDCPRLKTLAIGLGILSDCWFQPQTLSTPKDKRDILEQLALKYASQSRGPLQLTTLRLGHGIYLHASTSTDVGNYLAKLTNVRVLEALHLFNGLVSFESDLEGQYHPIDWDLFEGCDALRQLSVTRLTPNVVDWLNSKGQSVSELIIVELYSYHTHGLRDYRRLCLPNLRMLVTHQGHIADCRCDHNCNCDKLPICECDEPCGCDLPCDAYDEPVRIETDDERFLKSQWTVLDRLWDNGQLLTSLSLPLVFGAQWTNFAASLGMMKFLCDLHLETPRSISLYPHPKDSLWASATCSKDVAYQYALRLHEICPSLQRIRIGNRAWRVQYNFQQIDNEDTRNVDAVTLQPLSPEEISVIEIFNTKCDEQSGLWSKTEMVPEEEPLDETMAMYERIEGQTDEIYEGRFYNTPNLLALRHRTLFGTQEHDVGSDDNSAAE